MTLEELVSSFAEEYHIAGLELGGGGVAQFVVDGGMRVSIEASVLDEAAHLYCPVARLPEKGQQAFCNQLLQAQLFAREMGEGCCFGLSEESGEIFLNRKIKLQHLDAESFGDAINEFVNWCDHWKGKLALPAAAEGKAPEEAGVLAAAMSEEQRVLEALRAQLNTLPRY